MSGFPRLGIGLVGAGGFGEFCLSAFAGMDEVRIAGIADVDLRRAQRLSDQFKAKAHGEFESMLADPSVDIVAINTPPDLHAAQGMTALRAGKHVFCEKPLALTIADGQEMVDFAEKKRLCLTVDYVMRHNPFWAAAARLRESGVLGSLRHMDLANHAAGLALPATHWFWDIAKSGGIWIEHGVHFFDAFSWVSGEPGQVIASHASRRADGAIDRVEALLTYGDTQAHCYHAFDKDKLTEQTTARLTFDHGYVTLREWVPTSIELTTTVPRDRWIDLLPGQVEGTSAGGAKTRALAATESDKSAIYTQSIQAGMRDLVRAIADPSRALKVTGESALGSLRTAVEATRRATLIVLPLLALVIGSARAIAAPTTAPSATTQAVVEEEDFSAPTDCLPQQGSNAAGFHEKHEAILKRARSPEPIDIIFLGDSITEGWQRSDVSKIWDEHYGKMNAANFGVSEDRTQHTMWRITTGGELDGLHPKLIVILIGTHNIGRNSSDATAAGIAQLVSTVRTTCTSSKVLLLGIFPRTMGGPACAAQVKEINERIEKLDNGRSVRFLDIGPKVLGADGTVSPQIMPDGLHLSPAGYSVGADAMQPLLAEMLRDQ